MKISMHFLHLYIFDKNIKHYFQDFVFFFKHFLFFKSPAIIITLTNIMEEILNLAKTVL